MARRTPGLVPLVPVVALVTIARALVACRGVLGIDDGTLVDSTGQGDDAADSAIVSTSDGAVAPDTGASDAGATKDVATDGGCVTCVDGGCKVDGDCADPIRERCSNGMWSTDASFVCIARDVWGTLHADLPTGTVDFTEQHRLQRHDRRRRGHPSRVKSGSPCRERLRRRSKRAYARRMGVDVLRVLSGTVEGGTFRASTKLSRAQAEALLEAAYLATAANGDLSNEEASAYGRLVPAVMALAGETAKAPNDPELRAMLDRFDANMRHSTPSERLVALAPVLDTADVRDMAYKLSFALSLCDLATDDDEADFLDALTDALGLAGRVDELTAAVYADLDPGDLEEPG